MRGHDSGSVDENDAYDINNYNEKKLKYQDGKCREREIRMAQAKEIINIEKISEKLINVKIVGDSPLITHNWDVKAQREILEKEMGIQKVAKMKKNPYEDFASSMYWLDKMPETITKASLDEAIANGARFGFPLTAIKQAAISAAFRMKWSKDKMSLRGIFFIKPEADGYYSGDMEISEDQKRIDIIPNVFHPEPMVEIKFENLTMRRDMVRVGMGSADIRYRAEFDKWSMNFMVSFNENGQYNMDQIITMLNAGGYVCGIGEWRPEKDGQYGMFHVQGE